MAAKRPDGVCCEFNGMTDPRRSTIGLGQIDLNSPQVSEEWQHGGQFVTGLVSVKQAVNRPRVASVVFDDGTRNLSIRKPQVGLLAQWQVQDEWIRCGVPT